MVQTDKTSPKCFDCGQEGRWEHHVVPASRGGQGMVWLCDACHEKVHELGMRSDRHADLVRGAQAKRRAQGLWTGGTTPFGWRVYREVVVPCSYEQELALLAREIQAEGNSLREIGAELARRGWWPRGAGLWSGKWTHPEARGRGDWSAQSVSNLLKTKEAPRAEWVHPDVGVRFCGECGADKRKRSRSHFQPLIVAPPCVLAIEDALAQAKEGRGQAALAALRMAVRLLDPSATQCGSCKARIDGEPVPMCSKCAAGVCHVCSECSRKADR